jgi:hypothetical protein
MERPLILMGWQPYQNPNDVTHRDRKFNPKILMETEKTFNSESHPEQNIHRYVYHNA